MRAMRRATMLALCAATVPAWAEAPPASGPTLTLSGRVAHPHVFSAAEFATLPQVTIEAPESGKASQPARQFKGVLLWPLLDAAGWNDLPGRKTHLQHVVLARGRDGYAVALSIAELDPSFEGKQVIIATTQAGQPLAAPELIVPGDRRAARRVKDVVGIEIQ